ncbi:hypothetical protein [Flavobacterium praedii]|uniref:hypothetical protein n=1 Tax=Flavobacterium praedii TaxID=3002900 RepID=UPI0024820D24|nr:hypothetical protein [Flavobacterium praedii]
MNLRVAIKEDFADEYDNKKIGVLYFQQNHDGNMCTQPFYFNENTEIHNFRQLYSTGQIFVPVRIFDTVDILEETTN